MSTGLGIVIFFFVVSMSTYMFVGKQELARLEDREKEIDAIEVKMAQKDEALAKVEAELGRLEGERDSLRAEVVGLKRELEEDVSERVVVEDGIVRDPEKHKMVIEKIKTFVGGLGLDVKGVFESPIKGTKGNREFWIYTGV